jgi:hypothetical protein
VASVRAGRESRYALDAKPLDELEIYLAQVPRQWDETWAG